jgi:hypothetical protein
MNLEDKVKYEGDSATNLAPFLLLSKVKISFFGMRSEIHIEPCIKALLSRKPGNIYRKITTGVDTLDINRCLLGKHKGQKRGPVRTNKEGGKINCESKNCGKVWVPGPRLCAKRPRGFVWRKYQRITED